MQTLFRCQYQIGNHRFQDLLDLREWDNVQFNTEWLNPMYKPKLGETPFFHVKSLLLHEFTDRFDPPIPPRINDFQIFIMMLKETLIDYLARIDGPIVMLHSSGWDSRILSHCFAEMRDDGRDLDIQFICHEPEGDSFLEIMKRQGWKKDQYQVWDKPIDIGRIEPLNGWMPYMYQMKWWDLDESKYNLVMGMGGGELFDYPSRQKPYIRNLQHCFDPVINGYMNYFANHGEVEVVLDRRFKKLWMPYLSTVYMDIARRGKSAWLDVTDIQTDQYGNKLDLIRYSILKTFKIDTIDIPYRRHDYKGGYQWEIPYKKMEDFYYASKFYEDFKYPLPDFKIGTWGADLWGFAVTYEFI